MMLNMNNTPAPPPTVSPKTAEEMYFASIRLLGRFAIEGDKNWSLFNPSICHTEKHGTYVLFRSANGYLKDWREEFQLPLGSELDSGETYRYPSEYNAIAELTTTWQGEPRYHNRMFIAKMAAHPNTRLYDIVEVDLSEAYAQAPTSMLRGVEDGRLYFNGETFCISATAYETRHIPEARVVNIELDLSKPKKPRGVTFDMFDSPKTPTQPEKNWMPVHHEGLVKTPTFDYVYEAGKTYSIKDRTTTDVGGYILPLRGGSQLLPLRDGTYLGTTHHVTLAQGMRFSDINKSPIMRRRYAHRFVQYSEQGQIMKVSDPFTFLNHSVEFAAGMAFREDRTLVTFGALDSSAHLAVFSTQDVLDSLRRPNIVHA